MKYALKLNDDTVAIMVIIDPTVTVEDQISKLHDDLKNKIVSFREISDNDIPSDRAFRNAWKDTGSIEVDLVRAKQIIRDKRDQSLIALDKLAIAESRKPNGNIEAIDTEAQRLRDIPEDIRFESTDVSVLKELFDEATIMI
jgi:virulence-associated protein VagC